MRAPTNSLECIEQLIAFDTGDWSESQSRAWIYGVVIGWDIESMTELVKRFNWTPQQVALVCELHGDYVRRRQASVASVASLVHT